MKYEWDEETNMLKLDRVLHGAAFYPHDYGFIPQTLCGDGDPLVRVYVSCVSVYRCVCVCVVIKFCTYLRNPAPAVPVSLNYSY